MKTWPAGLATMRMSDSVPVLSHQQAQACPDPPLPWCCPKRGLWPNSSQMCPQHLVLTPKARLACSMGADLQSPSLELACCHCEYPTVNPVASGVPLQWVWTRLGQEWGFPAGLSGADR